MRLIIQLLIPALIFAGVMYLLTRRGRPRDVSARTSDTGAFVAILAVSAAVALATAWLLMSVWEG